MPKAAVLTGLNQPLEIHDVELESPHAGEVKIRMGASGVCHSDLSVQNGTLMGAPPIVLGHGHRQVSGGTRRAFDPP